jgi:hypothetical protein
MTSETIPNPGFNVSKFFNFIHMYYANVYIVVYYRRFFSWIVSLHNQQYKFADVPSRADYLNNHDMIMNRIYHSYYFVGTVHRFQQFFPKDQMRYYHLSHLNEPSLLEHFFVPPYQMRVAHVN